MIGAILVVAVTTVAVGAFGINRMSALSDGRDVVHDEGTVPVDALRKLQVDWWELQTHVARANIEALPAESRASSQDKAALAGQTLAADVEAAADLPLSPDAAAAFGEFAGATQEYLAWWPDPADRHRAQEQAAAAPLSWPPAPAQRGGPAGSRRPKAAGEAQVLAAMQPLIAQMNELEVTIVDSAAVATAAATEAAEVAAADARDAYESARTLTLVDHRRRPAVLSLPRPPRGPQRHPPGAADPRGPRPGRRRRPHGARRRAPVAPSSARWPRPSTTTLDALGNVLRPGQRLRPPAWRRLDSS